ncbi:hypothetical protein D3C71_1376330 [compost metagenome]
MQTVDVGQLIHVRLIEGEFKHRDRTLFRIGLTAMKAEAGTVPETLREGSFPVHVGRHLQAVNGFRGMFERGRRQADESQGLNVPEGQARKLDKLS